MDYKDLTPNLMVSDVAKTVEYYKEVLGFEAIASVPNGDKIVFAIVRANNIMLMFQEEMSLKEEYPQLKDCGGYAGLTLYIHVDNIMQLHEKLRDKVRIVKDLHTTFYGSQDFAIEDCNNYVLTFSQTKIE